MAQLADLEARLASVETALAAAQSGQSYSIGGRSLSRQPLEDLRAERTRLIRAIKATRAALEGAKQPDEVIASWYR